MSTAAHRFPPPTRMEAVTETLHGVEITDPYRWLEDQDSPATRQWIEEQNAFTSGLLGDRPERPMAKARLTELMKVDTIGWPVARDGVYFLTRRRADQSLSVIYRRVGHHGPEEVLVDPHDLSSDLSLSVSIVAVSDDGRLMAYGVRSGGEDETEVRVLDVESRQDRPDRLPRARNWGLSFSVDSSHFYYVVHTESGPRVYRHDMGTDVSADRLIFGEGYGPEKLIFCELSNNGTYLYMAVYYGAAAAKTEVFVLLTATGAIVPAVCDIEARFEGEFADDTLYLMTNDHAPNRKLIALDFVGSQPGPWRDVIPEQEKVMQGFCAAGGKLFVNYLDNVRSHIEIFSRDGEKDGDIHGPTLGTVSGVGGRWDKDEAFFAFTSFTVPYTIYRYSVRSGEQSVWAKHGVPMDPDTFETQQIWFTSKDGTRVPMFLVHKKGLKQGTAHKTLLTGYGGFNASLTPAFSEQAVLWAEMGGVYAVANLRGGGEFGENWHRAGMLESKQNVFDDFIAAAEWLVSNGYTTRHRLAIAGGSNGGLLVGAALTQRPEMFGAVVCSYPLLDMLRYHKFLVAGFWVPEYGSADDAAEFEYLRKYSPYHNVHDGEHYPATLFVTGDADTRVAPLHARKMAALLQAQNGSDRPILIHYNTKAGHSAGQPIEVVIDDASDRLAFLLWQLGDGNAE